MRAVEAFAGVGFAAVLATAAAPAAPAAAQSLLYDSTPLSSADVFNGAYYGGQLGVASSGEVATNAIVGYNFASLFDSNVIFGVEGTLGLRMPANTFDIWVKAKLGAAVSDNVWVYGLGGVGYSGFGGYQIGAGVEWAFQPDLWFSAELVGRGTIGGLPTKDYALYLNASRPFFTKDNPYDPSSEYLGNEFTPRLMWGVALGASTDLGAVMGGPEARLLFPVGNGLTVGARAYFDTALPGGVPQIFAGGQVGYDLTDNINVYSFADLGHIGSVGLANEVGVGATYGLDWHWHVMGEAFARGDIGSLTETSAKVGIFYRVAPPEGY